MDFELISTGWDEVFAGAAARAQKRIRVIAPFVQLSAVKALFANKAVRAQLITRFNLQDMFAGMNDLKALDYLLARGGRIKGVKHLHAKAYIFDDSEAIVTSANLTRNAQRGNHELGFRTSDPAVVRKCLDYFRRLWSDAGDKELDAATIARWRGKLDAVRHAGGGPKRASGLRDYGAIVPGHTHERFPDDELAQLDWPAPSDIDTIVVPAGEEGFQETFLGEDRWYKIRIHWSMVSSIKFIAAYRIKPISAITHVARVAGIRLWRGGPKYVLTFSGPARKIAAKKLVPRPKGTVTAPQGPRYTNCARLMSATTLDEAF